jgi:hypothetical protein
MKTYIVLLPVEKYDRNDDAEALEGMSINELNANKYNEVVRLELSDFMDYCNDSELNLNLYWVTHMVE